ncbi:hypothetical protein ACOZ38_39170 [Sphaerisporangium viridialbum]|uniref:hypothetical protein n=1 Tax=Sphaerisporangium viridialbum TaxID=46189 RepID=UPI003C7484A6
MNTGLADAIGQAGWSMAAVARAVNEAGRESGRPLLHGATAVAHWLTGAVPRSDTVLAATQAFTRRLGRDVSAADLGWPCTSLDPVDPWEGDPVAVLAALGEDDMLNRRTALTAGLYSLAALGLPESPAWAGERAGATRRAGPGDVDRIREMTRRLADADELYGGGHARAAVAAYLTHEVTPLLRGATGKARPDLFRAAAEVAYLAGWMAADAGAAGLAQRYYVQAVRLGEEAADPLVRAAGLRSMAVQAVEFGHATQGLALADAAAAGLRQGCPARTRAWITGMRAEANAAAGNRCQARNLLRLAERDLERADSIPESQWAGAYRRESLEHQAGLTLTALGDLPSAEGHLAASAGSRRTVERRARTLIGARLANVQLQRGEPEAAAVTVLGLRDDLVSVSSARVTGHLRALRAAWVPYRAEPQVGDADRFLATL